MHISCFSCIYNIIYIIIIKHGDDLCLFMAMSCRDFLASSGEVKLGDFGLCKVMPWRPWSPPQGDSLMLYRSYRLSYMYIACIVIYIILYNNITIYYGHIVLLYNIHFRYVPNT